jgi:hypothetical protein
MVVTKNLKNQTIMYTGLNITASTGLYTMPNISPVLIAFYYMQLQYLTVYLLSCLYHNPHL